MAETGRPSGFCEEISKAICDVIAIGMPEAYASTSQGVPYETYRSWKRKHTTFQQAIKKARGEAMLRRIKRIEKAAIEGTWQADAWYLERQFSEEFSLKKGEFEEMVAFYRKLKKESK